MEDVDAGLAEDAELASLGVAGDETADGVLAEVALLRDAADLEVGGCGGDVGVEAGG